MEKALDGLSHPQKESRPGFVPGCDDGVFMENPHEVLPAEPLSGCFSPHSSSLKCSEQLSEFSWSSTCDL